MNIFVELLIVIICSLSVTVWSEPWVGSRLGTTNYHKEVEAIDRAVEDYKKAVETLKTKPRKELLCVTFLRAAMKIDNDVLSNIKQTKGSCDWAIVIYDGEENEIEAICKMPEIVDQLVHCRRSPDSYSSEHHTKTSIPKTVLYQELVPVLPNYHRVFLMDEDISLQGFNLTTFLDIWKCAFVGVQPRPLIVQPLVAESNQYLMYVNEQPWKDGEWADVMATTVGYVEQQVPFFDSIFFEWFVTRVLSQTKQYSLEYGIDWGHDRSWCNAAIMYTRDVLHWPAGASPCALVTSRGTAIHHLNKMTMKIIRGNAAVFRKHAFLVVQKYVDLFPTWVGMDMLDPNNPLDPKNKDKFKQIRSLNASCLTEH